MDRVPQVEAELWEQLTAAVVACTRCPRLVAWREEAAQSKRRAYQDWDYWGKPVPGFGDRNARLAIVGLAPAAHGANRTGRLFTGDGPAGSAGTLMSALHRAGYANQPTSTHRGDGLKLRDAYITAVARCAPPGNRPKAAELANCRSYLRRELGLLASVEVVLCLGRVAFDGYLRLLRDAGLHVPRVAFEHGACYTFDNPDLPVLAASYHPSRQNTQTGRLTDAMLDNVFGEIRAFLSS
jgi:uracil-DNA glycosylase family 4